MSACCISGIALAMAKSYRWLDGLMLLQILLVAICKKQNENIAKSILNTDYIE